MATKRLKFSIALSNSENKRKFSPSKTDLNDKLIPKQGNQSPIETALSKYEKFKPKLISHIKKNSNSKQSRSRSKEQIIGMNLRGIKNFSLTGSMSIFTYEDFLQNNQRTKKETELKKTKTFEKKKNELSCIEIIENNYISEMNVTPNHRSSSPSKSRFYINNEIKYHQKTKKKGPKLDFPQHEPIPMESSLTLKTPLISSRYKNIGLYKLKTSNLEHSRRKRRNNFRADSNRNSRRRNTSTKSVKSILKKSSRSKSRRQERRASFRKKVSFSKRKMIVSYPPEAKLSSYAKKMKSPNYRIV